MKPKKGKNNMKSALSERYPQLKLNIGKLLSKTETLKAKDGVIQLSRNNPSHVDWYKDGEDDK